MRRARQRAVVSSCASVAGFGFVAHDGRFAIGLVLFAVAILGDGSLQPPGSLAASGYVMRQGTSFVRDGATLRPLGVNLYSAAGDHGADDVPGGSWHAVAQRQSHSAGARSRTFEDRALRMETKVDASILSGIDPRYFTPKRDFGRGFYATTSLGQAASWAEDRSGRTAGADLPVVVRLVIELGASASLDVLAFARGDYDAGEFWSLVWRCSAQDTHHGRSVNGGWYDVAIGPVSTIWTQRVHIPGADQLSFHTSRALAVLEHARREVVL